MVLPLCKLSKTDTFQLDETTLSTKWKFDENSFFFFLIYLDTLSISEQLTGSSRNAGEETLNSKY